MIERPTTTNLRQAYVAHLKEARNAAKLTQYEVALAIGMERTYYAKVERGVTNVSLETLDKIRRVLVVTTPALPNLAKQVADRVNAARQGKYSQEALGREAGLSVAYVGRLERCDTSVSLDQLDAIARVLGVDPFSFISF